MSFFVPVSTPVLDEGSAPILRRAFDQARRIGNYALVQAAVQIIAFSSGILLVRWLPQREYAYFTIANAMQATLMLLADIGISVGLISIGGRVWQDRHRFGELINTGLAVRKKLAAGAVVIVTPILYAMLARNGASAIYTMLLIAFVLAGFSIQLSVDIFSVVPRLRSDIGRIQKIDFTCAIVRLLLILGLVYVFATAGLAVAIASVTFLLQYLLLRAYAAKVVDLKANENAEDRQEIVRLIKNLAANAVFYCFQGQITVFLISFFARRAASVAEVGALGRLAMIFTVLTNLLINIFVPAFARCQDRRKLRYLYAAIAGGVILFSAVVLGGAALFPDQFLFVLGNRYSHLHRELLLMIGVAVISAFSGTLWLLNASKAWVSGAWLYIPLTLATQIALIPFTDFSSVAGVLIFNLISAVPSLLLNLALSYRGFRNFAPSAG
ncbi:MAG: polysaccharide biosynthesis protein [Verrucomicrobiota bacterium]|nr:polysaccharide biosynthesis protein [Verrucomicrobiota bacterium]